MHYCTEALAVLLIAIARRGFPAEIEPGTYTMRQKQAGQPLSYVTPIRSYTTLQLKYTTSLLNYAPPLLSYATTLLNYATPLLS